MPNTREEQKSVSFFFFFMAFLAIATWKHFQCIKPTVTIVMIFNVSELFFNVKVFLLCDVSSYIKATYAAVPADV